MTSFQPQRPATGSAGSARRSSSRRFTSG